MAFVRDERVSVKHRESACGSLCSCVKKLAIGAGSSAL